MDSVLPGSFCVPASLKDWSRRGWNGFDGLDRAEHSATRTNARDSSIDGLSYSIHQCQEGEREKIFVRIDSWCYDKSGAATDLPVLEIVFDASRFSAPAKAAESVKVMARPIPLSEKVASRAVNAALFLINQIRAEQVPDFERVLELHRIHPGIHLGQGLVSSGDDKKKITGTG